MAHKSSFLQLLVVSVGGHLLACLAVWLTARAFDIDMPVLGTSMVTPMILLVASLPISISGWGVREGGMIVGLGMLGVSSADAALVSVVFGLISVLLGIVGGLVWVATGSEAIRDGQSVLHRH